MRTKIHNAILVGTGKGGVGKSSFSILLALELLSEGNKVGLIDCDISGPSIPKILGLKNKIEGDPKRGIIPPTTIDGLKVFSTELFMNDKKTCVLWNGDRIHEYITKSMEDINWGTELDYLIADLPPGSGSSPQAIIEFLKENRINTGLVLITTPQDVAMNDILKSISMADKLEIPVLGIVENMSVFICPKCKEIHHLFGKGKVSVTCIKENLSYLGYIPLIPELSIVSDTSLNLKTVPDEIKPYISIITINILKSLGD